MIADIDMTKTPNFKLVKFVGILVVTMILIGRILGKRLDQNQLLGCLFVGSFLILFSLLAFLLGAIPLRHLGSSDKTIKRAFIFACLAFFYSIIQIPLWCLATNSFPPAKLDKWQATWATLGVIISLLGPAALLVVKIGRKIVARDKERNTALRHNHNGGRDEI